jgi:ABC-type transporter Mla MlaB component
MKTSKRKQRDARAKTAPQAVVIESSAAAADVAVAAVADVPPEPAVELASAEPAVEAAPAAAAVRQSAPTLALASICSVKDAAALKESLGRLAESGGAVCLEVGSVERVDTATLQLLCALSVDFKMSDRQLNWSGDSPALREAARLLGVSQLLGLPQTTSMGAAA